MATEDIQVGQLSIPVVADLRKFNETVSGELKARAEKAAAEAAEKAGDSFADRLADAVRKRMSRVQQVTAQGGQKAGERLATQLEQAYRTRIARAKLDLQKGAIDEASFKQRGVEAAEIFNQGLLREIERLRAGGILSATRLQDLTGLFKNAGTSAGKALGEGITTTAQQATTSGLGVLATAIKGFFALQIVQLIGRVVGQVVGYFGQAKDAAVGVAQSYLRLASASKLYGVEQRTLNELSQQGIQSLHLSATVANELAANAAKIAGRAGEAARAQELWAASLDLAAANGLDAAAAAEALDQSFKGMDEGLNKLGLSDPGQLFKQFADQAGIAAENLTDAQKQQAILNAIVEAGRKVQGEYGRQLQGDLGKLNTWEATLRRAKETIGAALIPVIVQLTDKMEGPLSSAVKTITSLLDGMLSPTERLARQMERLGLASEYVLPLTLQDRIDDTKKEIRGLQGEIDELSKPTAFFGLADTMAGRRGFAGLEGAALLAKRAEIAQKQTEALQRGATGEAAGWLNVLKTIDELIAKQKALSEANKTLTATETALGEATGKRDLRVQLDATNERIAAIGRETNLTVSLVQELNNLYATREKLEKQLGLNQPAPTAPTTTPNPLTDAEIKKIDAAREALEARIRAFQALAPLREMGAAPEIQIPDTVPAQLQRIYEIDEQIRQIEGEIAAARGQAPAGIRAVVGALEAERSAIQANVTAVRDQFEALPRVQAEVAQVVRTLGEMQQRVVRDSAGQWHTVAEGMLAVKKAAEEAAEAQRALVAAQLSGDPERIAEAKRQQAEAEDRAREAARRALDIFERGTGKGATAQKELNALIAQMVKLLQDAGVETEKSEGRWEGLAQTIEAIARGVLSVADALGVLDDQSRRALQGLIDVADAAAKIGADPADIGAWIQGIGGLVGALSGLFGESEEDRQRIQQHRDAMVDLTRALLALKDAYLGNVSGERLRTDFSFVGSLAGQLSVAIEQGLLRGSRQGNAALLARQMGLVDAGASREEGFAALQKRLDEIDQVYGTGLADILERGSFNDLLTALQKLGPEITAQIDKLGQFGDSVADIIDRVNFQFQVLGNNNAAEKLAAINDALKAAGKTAGDFQDEFDELASLDLNTEAGRARRDEIVQAMSEAFSAGEGFPGALSVDQMRDLILQWAQATGEAVATEPPAPTGDLVADTLARVRFELDALGKTDAVERIRATVQALRAAGVSFGEFSDELAALDKLDLSTPEGQAQQAALIAQIVARMGTEGANFGGFTPEALRDLVLEYARARGETAEPGAGETQSQGVQRGVTEVTARRQTSLLTTIAYWEEQSGRALQALLQRQYPAGIPSVAPPSPAALGLGPSVVNGPVNYQIQTGDVVVNLESVQAVDEATVQRIAAVVSAKQVQQIDQALGDRIRRQQRATGQNTARR